MQQKHFTRAEIDSWRVAVGQGGSHIPSRSQVRNVPEVIVPSFRPDIRQEIYKAVKANGGAMSRCQIAKAVQRRKSTWLNSLIEALVDEGLLCRVPGLWKNGVIMYYYEIAEAA